MPIFVLTFLTLLSFLSISYAVIPSETVLDAVEILSDSGYLAMSLTLQIVAPTLISQSSSVTIFAPSDSAFRESGQPSLNLLQYHFCPVKFSLESLGSLPFGTKIPTFLPNQSLIVTTSASHGKISLNNITINGSAIYDVGSLAVFGIDKFFDPSLQISISLPPAQSPSSNFVCKAPFSDDQLAFGVDSIARALGPLKSRGYSVMASFLGLQLPWIRNQMKLTVFAPVDEYMEQYVGNFSDSSIFHRHILPCSLSWTDLVNLGEGVTLRTFAEDFTIKLSTSGDVLVLNGVPVIFPDMYSSDSLFVHGIQQVLTLRTEEVVGESFSEFNGNRDDNIPDYDCSYGDSFWCSRA